MYQPDIVPLCLYEGKNIDFPIPISSDPVYGSTFKCNPVNLEKEFYVINGDFRPIPVGMIMYCASGIGTKTLSLEVISDIYNTEYPKSCIRFIAWGKPVPNTIPITIGKQTIYVLSKNLNKFIIKDNRCIPDPLGKPLDQCMVDNIQQSNGKQQSLLIYLEKTLSKQKSYSVFSFVCLILILVILGILFLMNSKN